MSQFIANKKVVVVSVVSDYKTPSGNDMVKVSFSDETEEVMPKSRFEMIVTDRTSDATAVQILVRSKLSSLILALFNEYGVKMGEADAILNSEGDLVNISYETARDYKWGFAHRDLPLNIVNNVLLEKNAKQSDDGASSTGGTVGTGSEE